MDHLVRTFTIIILKLVTSQDTIVSALLPATSMFLLVLVWDRDGEE